MIVEPAAGETVDQPTVIIRGRAPPGSTVTRDIPLWFDDHTLADNRGRWFVSVDLAPGENRLTFRIGDDSETSRTITVVYQPD